MVNCYVIWAGLRPPSVAVQLTGSKKQKRQRNLSAIAELIIRPNDRDRMNVKLNVRIFFEHQS